jgi:hypothetical protein
VLDAPPDVVIRLLVMSQDAFRAELFVRPHRRPRFDQLQGRTGAPVRLMRVP